MAFDKSLEMLKLARARLHHLPAEKTEIVCGDFNDLPLEQANFDTVVLHQVLHFAQDPELVLEQAARVTRPNGRTVIVDFAAHSHEEFRDLYAHSRLGFYDHQIEQIFNFVGFTCLPPIELEGKELVVKIWIGKHENYQFKEKKAEVCKDMSLQLDQDLEARMAGDSPLFKGLPGDIEVSFEFFPPKTEKMSEALWKSVETLKPLDPRFASVTYGAGGSTRERTHQQVVRIQNEASIPAAAHLTCVSATKEEVNEVAKRYWEEGVRHICSAPW